MPESVTLCDTLAKMEELRDGHVSVEDALIDVFENVTRTDVRPCATRESPGVFDISGHLLVDRVDPIVPMSVVLMIDDICHAVFDKLAQNKKLKKRIEGLLDSDEQLVIAAIIDLLTPYLGVPPLCVVTALLVKLGFKKFLGGTADNPQYEKGIVRKLFGPYLPDGGVDQLKVDLFAAQLHGKAGNHALCKARLIRCEDLCRRRGSQSDLNSVGYQYIEIGENERGRGLVSEALEYSPDDPAALDSLAWANYRLGDSCEALKCIQKALRDENKILAAYNEDALMEVLYHGILIARALRNKQLEDTYSGRLARLDEKNKWRSKLG